MKLLDELQRQGITLAADGHRLRCRGPVRLLTPELRRRLVTHKPALLAYLQQRPGADLEPVLQAAASWSDLEAVLEEAQRQYEASNLPQEDVERLAVLVHYHSHHLPAPGEEERLSHLLHKTPTCRMRSGLLGEDILLAADDAEIPPDNTLVVYRESELRRVVGRPPEQLRRIHVARKMLDGELLKPGRQGTTIHGEDLWADASGDEDEACGCCGGRRWWDKAGQRVCATCHPRPEDSRGPNPPATERRLPLLVVE